MFGASLKKIKPGITWPYSIQVWEILPIILQYGTDLLNNGGKKRDRWHLVYPHFAIYCVYIHTLEFCMSAVFLGDARPGAATYR